MVSLSTLKKAAVVGGVAAIGGAVFMTMRLKEGFKQQGFYKESIKMLRESVGAQTVLGLPIWDKSVDLMDPFNKIEPTEAQIKVPVVGSKAKGHLYSWATREQPGKDWTVDRLELELESRVGYRLLVFDSQRRVA